MYNSLKGHLQDNSTSDMFCFALRCSECGAELKSTPILFPTESNMPSDSENKSLPDKHYRLEKMKALELAAAEIKRMVNLCPICRRTVCDHCFIISDTIDMCTDCARRLNVRGEPVMIRPEL